MNKFFKQFAEMVEDQFGTDFNREEGFFICPQCAEPLYDGDWPVNKYMEFTIDGHKVWRCPICGTILIVEDEAE